MTILYVSCPLNKLAVIEINDAGNLLGVIQTVSPVVDPLPEGLLVDNGMTEWISVSADKSLLYALTSFWNKAHAVVTAFAIHADGNGSLTKLGDSVSTRGYQAASGAFSADGSTYVVGHHNCGTITVLSVLEDGPPIVLSTLQPPTLLQQPRNLSLTTSGSVSTSTSTPLPTVTADAPPEPKKSVHQVQYFAATSSMPETLVVADCAQDAAIIYEVDDMGHLDDRPLAHVSCRPHEHVAHGGSGWAQWLFRQFMQRVLPSHGVRVRRAVLGHVQQQQTFLYCLGELTNCIQVYRVDTSSTAGGAKMISIDKEPLQDMVVAGHSLEQSSYIGLALTVVSELQVYDDGMVLVGVRGMAKLWGSRAEMGVRVLKQLEDGRLELGQWIETPGAVRHFCRRDKQLFVGINSEDYPFVQTYALQEDGLWKLTGQAKVDMDVFCVVPL